MDTEETLMIRSLAIFGLLLAATTGWAEDSAKVEVGRQAPDFAMTGIDGQTFKLSDKLGKDQHVVLIFSRAHW
jgi:cytochrome oxidase Cu insertion factor (SCO1/SenC/PrrC family)